MIMLRFSAPLLVRVKTSVGYIAGPLALIRALAYRGAVRGSAAPGSAATGTHLAQWLAMRGPHFVLGHPQVWI
ncbi:hypothetical protein C8F04DRAFT_1251649 [Mycena alexandri]|uniref:Uncharacterized protein n=1 Tax=Mycena alexandri TaxID=1745969 RepID=A0AAD6TF71_9AGAR|nr:hypothetical protein C8F04DRAFT_1251649 [Mycena alexandri]